MSKTNLASEDWYKTRTEIVPDKELNDGEHYNAEKDDAGPHVIYSPDYGDGLKHPYFDKVKLPEKKGGSYDGDQLRIPLSQVQTQGTQPV